MLSLQSNALPLVKCSDLPWSKIGTKVHLYVLRLNGAPTGKFYFVGQVTHSLL